MKALIVVLALLVSACVTTQPQIVAEPRIEYRDVPRPTPVPCFDEKDRPVQPEPAPIDLENATTDQMAAAVEADRIADDRYMRQLEALFIQCMKTQGKEVR